MGIQSTLEVNRVVAMQAIMRDLLAMNNDRLSVILEETLRNRFHSYRIVDDGGIDDVNDLPVPTDN